jgi:PAS domain S-box-containing protein
VRSTTPSVPWAASSERARALSKAAGTAAAGVGLVVLAGWALEVDFLKGPIPGLIDMKANTALGFLAMGLALRALAGAPGRRRLLPVAGAWLTIAIGAISSAEYLLGANLGIDELLFHDPGGAATVNPGRLAPQTAIIFVLLGAGLLMARGDSRTQRWLGQALPLASGAVSLFAILGYIYGIRGLSTVGPFSPMAFHTALTALVLSLGMLFARPDRVLVQTLCARTAGGLMARRLLPAAFIGIPVIGWVRLYGEDSGLYGREVGVALYALVLVSVLTAVILFTARALNRADAAREEAAFGQRRLAAIVESSDDAIFSMAPDGVVTSWNPGAERLFGYQTAEIVGRPATVLVAPGEQDEAETARTLEEVAAGRGLQQQEARLARKDGTPVDVSVSLAPLRDHTGAIIGASAVIRDVTERRRTERALEESRDEAERANRAKSEFLSRMSHELRTPLNAILGFGQLLQMDELEPSQQDDVEQIVKAGRHLLDLINELLEISRIEAGEMAMSIESVPVGPLLAESADLMSPLAAERGLPLKVACADAGDRHVQADNQRLKQVLLNLLSNAVKYNREGGDIDVACVQAPGERIRITVSDTGPGIPADRLDRLFAPFERLGAEHTPVEGTGLGLALSKRLVEAMGGTLTVQSEVGSGTTFAVELPQASTVVGELEADRGGAEGVLISGNRGGSASVLYIEDNISNYRLVEQILDKRPELKLIAAMEGQLGLDLAREHQPDLVLLDLHLPGMPGEAVLAALREDPRTARVPVVVISADATDGQLARLIAAGADAYLSKPIDVRRFLEVVEEQLGAGVERTA